MKHLLLSSLAIILACHTHAQVNLGLKAGLNYSMLDAKLERIDEIDKPTLLAGAFARFKVNRISLQFEGLLALKSGDLESPEKSITEFEQLTLDVPVLLGLRLANGKVVKLRALAGVVQSVQLGELGDIDAEDYNPNYLSAAAGLSLDIPLFVIDLRYQHALTPALENAAGSIKSNLLTLSLGYKFL